jgi:hypothetical protein
MLKMKRWEEKSNGETFYFSLSVCLCLCLEPHTGGVQPPTGRQICSHRSGPSFPEHSSERGTTKEARRK